MVLILAQFSAPRCAAASLKVEVELPTDDDPQPAEALETLLSFSLGMARPKHGLAEPVGDEVISVEVLAKALGLCELQLADEWSEARSAG